MNLILDGLPANPENFLEINYEFDMRDRKRMVLNPDENVLTFFGEDRQRILDFVATYSRAQGMPCTIDFGNYQIEMYLDFTTDAFEIGSDFVNCEMVRRGATKSFINLAQGRLLSVVNWQPQDFEEIEYQIIQPQQGLLFISLLLALLSLKQEIAQSIKDIQEGIADLTEALTPTAGVPPAIVIGAVIAAAIKLAARIAYAIFIFAALIEIISQILELIFPPIRTFKCMRLSVMAQRAAQDLGFTLNSNLLNSLSGATIIPVPLRKKDPTWFEEVFFDNSLAYTEGYPTSRDTIQTIADLFDFIETTFNAETVVNNNVIRLENRSWFFDNANANLQEYFNVMPDETTLVGYADTIHKRKLFSYLIDGNDINTLDDQRGSIDEWNTSLISSPYPDIIGLKGFENVNINCARAMRKRKLTAVENFAREVAEAVDFFTGGNLAAQIADRINIMQLSDQYFTVTKFAWCVGNRLHPNQNQFIGTEALENNYHSDRRVENNQIKLTVGMPIGLGLDRILEIEQNNYVNLGNRIIRVNNINFNYDDNDAVIDFEEREPMPNVITTLL